MQMFYTCNWIASTEIANKYAIQAQITINARKFGNGSRPYLHSLQFSDNDLRPRKDCQISLQPQALFRGPSIALFDATLAVHEAESLIVLSMGARVSGANQPNEN